MSTIQPSANCAEAQAISLAMVYSTTSRQTLPADGGWLNFDCQTNTFVGGYASVDIGKEVQIDWYFGCDGHRGTVTISGQSNWNPANGIPSGAAAFTIETGSYHGPVSLRVKTPSGGSVSLYLAEQA